MERILVIEDDKELCTIILSYLQRENYDVEIAYDGIDAIKKARDFNPSLIFLDLNLPKLDGEQVIREIRKFSIATVIVLSAKNTEEDKLLLLALGADDYMTKPFSMKEMTARAKAVFRRKNIFVDTTNNKIITKERIYGRLVINSSKYQVTIDGEQILFTSKEFKMLEFLTLNEKIVFSKSQLIDELWGNEAYINENAVVVTVTRIRDKLKKFGIDNIRTVWGAGYKWE